MLQELNVQPLWEHLKTANKPIVLYGMGNGADMIIDIMSDFGLDWDDIFASDEFVRGHSFRGKRVLKFSEVEEKYEDFIILMTFAVHDEKTLSRIKDLSQKHEFYAPTAPIIGSELFTQEYIKAHEKDFEEAYELLADEKSKETFIDILKFKISGKVDFLFKCHYEKMLLYKEILPLTDNEIIADLGAYDGDTIREFLSVTDNKYKKIIAFEPDSRNYKKLTNRTAYLENIEYHNLGAWNKKETLLFSKEGSRNSKQKDNGVPMGFDSLDNISQDKISFIKMDIEGAELKALEGAERIIQSYHPKLYICAYHRNEDFFVLPKKIKQLCPEYKIYLRAHPYIPAWETNFYAICD